MSLYVCAIGLSAQNLSLSNANGALSPGDTISLYIANNVDHYEHVYVTNNSGSSMDVKVRKHEIELLAGAMNTFCWGVCVAPSTLVSPYSITIDAGQTNTNDFSADYNGNENDGLTIVRYTFFDDANPSDTVDIVIKFYTSPVSIGEIAVLKTEISNPYPNPASTNCQFNYIIPLSVYDAKIVITDLAGNIVNTTSLIPGEGKASIDVSAFASGIYFYSLWIYDKPHTTRKLIVQR